MVYFWVGLAGALGAMLRYLVGIWLFTNYAFPYATLAVNLIGSYLLARLTIHVGKKYVLSPVVTLAIGTGFIGSFTTFSTLSMETVQLFHDGKVWTGVFYIVISVVGGLFMCHLGFKKAEGGMR